MTSLVSSDVTVCPSANCLTFLGGEALAIRFCMPVLIALLAALVLFASNAEAQETGANLRLDTNTQLQTELDYSTMPKTRGPLAMWILGSASTVGFTAAFATFALGDCIADAVCDDDAKINGTLAGTLISASVAITGMIWWIVRKIQRRRWLRGHERALAPPLTFRW